MSDALDPALRAGTMIGPWRIERRLGGGGVGTVYAAEDPTIRKRVAVKVLRSALADDAAAAARFEREARAANDVRHPGIVDVLSLGRLPDGRPYLVMSLLEGRSLRDELAARGALPPAEAWSWVRQVAEALGAAHAEGVVHRDVKPDNVFLERHGGAASTSTARARVLDFGLAQVTESIDGEPVAKLTQTGVPMGTPAYMAPEQWWAHEATPATDQYAVGAMLFELLAGRPPFASPRFAELLQQHLHEAPPRLADVGVAVPEPVEALVARALAKAPADRFASMAALVEAGDRAFAGADGVAPARAIVVATSGAASASDPAIAHAATVAASGAVPSAAAAPDARDAGGGLGRFAALYAGAIAIAILGLLAAGYAGPDRRRPLAWLVIAGQGGPAAALWGVLGAVGLGLIARRRARGGAAGTGALWIAAAPALTGALATYAGWQKIQESVEDWAPTERFTTFGLGIYEANAGRFVGQALGGALCLGLCALAGVAPGPERAAWDRRVGVAALAGFVAVAIAVTAAAAPSAALVAGAGAAVVAVGLLAPRRGPLPREIERAAAGVLCVALAAAVGLGRVEARETILWEAAPTRAARAEEIVAAAGERGATTGVAIAALIAIAAYEAWRLRGLHALASPGRPRAGAVALAAVVAVAGAVDVALHARAQAEHARLREAMARQFSLFAELDPPSGDALADGEGPAGRFAPHPAAALQVARQALGVDAVPVAPVAALESESGAKNLERDLAQAIARGAVKAGADAVSLSVAIDRDVPWPVAARALRAAHAAGARRVELLLTRGPRPALARRGPPEASWVVPGDFVALPATLGDDGVAPGPDRRFGDVASELARRTLAGEAPVRLSVR